jgi:hypothetical protein
MLLGGLSAFSLSGQVTLFNGHMMLGAHVAGLVGAGLLFGFALSVPHLRYSARHTVMLARAFVATNVANVVISAGKSFFNVHGIGLSDSMANNVVFGLLGVTVVAPTLACTFLWAYGMRGAPKRA